MTQETRTPCEELNAYMSTTFAREGESPLQWWARVGAHRFPHLFKLVPEFFPIAATSAASERLFSSGRGVVSYRRAGLNARSIEFCLTIKSWIRSEKQRLRDIALEEAGEESDDEEVCDTWL